MDDADAADAEMRQWGICYVDPMEHLFVKDVVALSEDDIKKIEGSEANRILNEVKSELASAGT